MPPRQELSAIYRTPRPYRALRETGEARDGSARPGILPSSALGKTEPSPLPSPAIIGGLARRGASNAAALKRLPPVIETRLPPSPSARSRRLMGFPNA